MSDDRPSGEKEIALEARAAEADRLFSPSAARNRDVIRDAFLRLAPADGDVLEIGSGTGEHAVRIAAARPGGLWRPGDPDAASRRSIAAWTAHLGLTNVARPHAVDATRDDWGAEERTGAYAAIVSINMIHIAPFAAARGVFAGAGRLLRPDGRLFLYGPFSRDGVHTAPSNVDFDASLKSRDPDWGVRDLERDLAPLADAAGLDLAEIIEMPANNLSVAFARR
ncbi:MAG: DUF938 domain-containing protein [Parvularculaceae bacterium]